MEIAALVTLAIGAAFATFFSPCAYGLLPSYIGFYVASSDSDVAPGSGALIRGLAATAGVLVMLGSLSLVVVMAGASLEIYIPVIEPFVGMALIAMGGYVLLYGGFSLDVLLPERSSSILGFGLFGALYALAATACVLPFFLALVLQSLTLPVRESILVMGSFVAWFGLLMLGVTVAAAAGYKVSSERFGRYSPYFMDIAGVLMILGGLAQLYVSFTYSYGETTMLL